MYKIIATNSSKEVEIRLYGEIEQYSDNSARNLSYELQNLGSKYERINLHVHSGGGDVFEGLAIFNAIRNSKVPVYTYVDGMAASMASVVILAGEKVFMSKNSFLMIHQPYFSGGGGNAKELKQKAELLEKVIETLSNHYIERNPDLASKIKEWMSEGDHWITALEAKELGLIDEIVETKTALKPLENFKAMQTSEVYNYFIDDLNTNSNEQQEKMENKLKLRLVALGLALSIDASDTEFGTAIEKALKENADLKTKIKELEEAAKNKDQQELDQLLEVSKNKLSKNQIDALREMAKTSGIEAIRKFIKEVPERKPIMDKLKTNSENQNQDWDWFQENDPKTLQKMDEENPEAFNQLYKEKYGVFPGQAV